ncbi:MAG: RluA family pseudouridine synthase [bacterium]
MQKLKVEKNISKARLDIYLQKKLNISRSQIQKNITGGLIIVDGDKVKPSYVLMGGEIITIKESEKNKYRTEIPTIIYQDNDILVIDKPSGITVHEAPGEKEVTINEIFKDSYSGDNTVRGMIVHRLDKGTSGVMILAKNKLAAENLKKEFASRRVEKEYIALVNGFPEGGTINIPLGRNGQTSGRIIALNEGRPSRTDFTIIEKYVGYSLVLAKPKTGRTHQIRVHFSAIGHPVYGDKKYGFPKENSDRIFLHASNIRFIHPITGKKVKFNSKMPVALQAVIDTLVIE